MDLFQSDPQQSPLADRMRPRNFDEVVGQDHLCAPGSPFRAMVDAGELLSAILWGPPGVGKTTLAQLVADRSGTRFEPFSAVLSGIKEVREVMTRAKQDRALKGRRTLVFVDEIHRFNRAQQDAFLPHVESGDIILLGATTENPSFEVNAALLSRCSVFVLRPLTPESIVAMLQRAIDDPDRGLAGHRLQLADGVLEAIANFADGDGRKALNALETVANATRKSADGSRQVARERLQTLLHKRIAHDKSGDSHYDLASALIKSVRNSDPDAAVYYLARLLEGGEDVKFVARRLVILASEDIGLADPQALPLAVAAQQAAHFIGMPEALFPLTEAALYLALAPKSNSVLTAYASAKADIEQRANAPVPLHLRNAKTGLMKSLGYGEGYRYAHDEPAAADMSCLPEALADRRYYEPKAQGTEPELAERWRRRKGAKD